MKWRDYMRSVKQTAAREYWAALIIEVDGNISEAARRADVNRVTVYDILQQYGIVVERKAADDTIDMRH